MLIRQQQKFTWAGHGDLMPKQYLLNVSSAHIVPEGWNSWKGDLMFPDKEKTAFYAEYQNTGKGANTTNRVVWAKQLTTTETKLYSVQNVLKGRDGWYPLQVK